MFSLYDDKTMWVYDFSGKLFSEEISKYIEKFIKVGKKKDTTVSQKNESTDY